MIYIASPYSADTKAKMNQNFTEVSIFTSKLVKRGLIAISPVTYGHILSQYEDLPDQFEFWKDFCNEILSKCELMVVYQLPGWETSTGVSAEIEYCNDNGIPIIYTMNDPFHKDILLNHLVEEIYHTMYNN